MSVNNLPTISSLFPSAVEIFWNILLWMDAGPRMNYAERLSLLLPSKIVKAFLCFVICLYFVDF